MENTSVFNQINILITNLKPIEADFKKIGTYRDYKFQVVPDGVVSEEAHLDVSIGTSGTYIGQGIQKASRTFNSILQSINLSSTKTDYLSVIQHIGKLNTKAQTTLESTQNYLKSSGSLSDAEAEAILHQLESFENSLEQALEGLKAQGKDVYQNESLFKPLVEQINTIKEKYLAPCQAALIRHHLENQKENNRNFQNLRKISPVILEGLSNDQSTHATGANIVGKIGAVAQSALWAVQNYMQPEPISKELENSGIKMLAKVLLNPSAQLNTTIVYTFLNAIADAAKKDKGTQVELAYDYYFSSIQNFSLEDIAKTATKLRAQIEKEPSLCIVMPIVLEQSGPIRAFERRHIVTVMIQNKEIAYFDSKGVTSNNKVFKGGNSMRDVLDTINNGALLGQGKIVENPYIMQGDINNCGVFVSNYLYQRTMKEKSHTDICKEGISSSEVLQFRKEMVNILKQADDQLTGVITSGRSDVSKTKPKINLNPSGILLATSLTEQIQNLEVHKDSKISEGAKTITWVKSDAFPDIEPYHDSDESSDIGDFERI